MQTNLVSSCSVLLDKVTASDVVGRQGVPAGVLRGLELDFLIGQNDCGVEVWLPIQLMPDCFPEQKRNSSGQAGKICLISLRNTHFSAGDRVKTMRRA